MIKKPALLALTVAVMSIVACDNPLQTSADGTESETPGGQNGSGYTVQYHANDASFGRVPIDENEYPAGASVALLRNYGGLEKDGHTFDGWNTEPDGTGVQYYIGESFTMPENNANLYAQWSDVEPCFTMNAATGTITQYLTASCGTAEGHIDIPETVEGAVVRRIGRALFNLAALTSVDFPDTVVEVEPYAFNNNDLTHLTLPRDLEVIGTAAFARNRDLVSVQFGSSIREIHEDAFWTANPTEVRLPHGVEHIGSSAFSNALGVGPELVEIPASVRVVENGTFAMNKIATLILHEGIQVLMRNAFRDNDLTAVELPSSVISVDQGVFQHNAITEITIGSDVEIYDATSFGDHGESFREYYIEKGQQAGTYTFNGAGWSRE